MVQKIRDALKDSTSLEIEILNYRKDGTPFINGFMMMPLHFKGKTDGPAQYFLAVQKNVSIIVNPWKAPMNQWTVPEVCMWLEKIGAASYIKTFLNKDVSGAQLEQLTMDGLNDLGIVLTSEKNRIYKLITEEKAQRIQAAKANDTETSVDDTSVTTKQIEIDDETSEDVGSMSTRMTPTSVKPTKSTKFATVRKINISVHFKNKPRSNLSVLAYSNAGHEELRRIFRKKFGRKYDILSFEAKDGTTSSLTAEVEPTFEGLDPVNFAVLEGFLCDAVFVTDNVGLILFANDTAWERLGIQEDPVDRSIATLMSFPFSKLDYVR